MYSTGTASAGATHVAARARGMYSTTEAGAANHNSSGAGAVHTAVTDATDLASPDMMYAETGAGTASTTGAGPTKVGNADAAHSWSCCHTHTAGTVVKRPTAGTTIRSRRYCHDNHSGAVLHQALAPRTRARAGATNMAHSGTVYFTTSALSTYNDMARTCPGAAVQSSTGVSRAIGRGSVSAHDCARASDA